MPIKRSMFSFFIEPFHISFIKSSSQDDSRILGFYFSFSSPKRGTHCEIAPSNCWMRSNSLTEFWLELFESKKKCSELIGRHR